MRDSEIIKGIKKEGKSRDRALGALIKRAHRVSGNVKGKLTGISKEVIEDCASDAMWHLVDLIKEDRFELKGRSGISAFLFTATRNRALNAYRFQGKFLLGEENEEKLRSLEDKVSNALDLLIEREKVEVCKNALREMKPKCRRLLQSIYYEGLSGIKCAERLKMTSENVRVSKKRCLETLRAILGNSTEWYYD